MPEQNDLGVIWGAKAIAREINRTRRETYHLLEAGHLPAKKVGGQWCSTRERLRRLFDLDGDQSEVRAHG